MVNKDSHNKIYKRWCCSADKRLKEQRDAMVVVSNNGEVLWIPPAIYMSSCGIDITHFPFDIQECYMKFGSWTYDGLKLDIHFYGEKAEIDISDYIESNEWNLIGHPAERRVQYYVGLDAPYVDLQFYIMLQRVAIFYKYILVLPCVLLSFPTLVIFLSLVILLTLITLLTLSSTSTSLFFLVCSCPF